MNFQLKYFIIGILLISLLFNDIIATPPVNNNYIYNTNARAALIPHSGKGPTYINNNNGLVTDKIKPSSTPKNCKRHLPLQLGPSQQQQQQQYTLVNMILVTTLDGSIRGISRNGKVFWTIRGGPRASIVKSNIQYETKLFNSNNTNNIFNDNNKPNDYFDDVLDDEDTYEQQDSTTYFDSSKNIISQGINPQDLDVSFIIEPDNGGILYIFTQDEPLQRLPFTMKDIVNQFTVTYDGTVFFGSKSTFIIAIDPRSGKIIKKIGGKDHQSIFEMLSSKNTFSESLIYIGRNEYKVNIEMNGIRWQLTYSEYEPNAMNMDIPLHMAKSDIYFAPLAEDCSLTPINRTDGEIMVGGLNLPYPVNMVFDVYTSPDYSITLSKQSPPKLLNKGTLGSAMKENAPCYLSGLGSTSAFVGVHEGTLYAFSNERYPLIQLSKKSLMYSDGNRKLIEGGEKYKDKYQHLCDWTRRPFSDVCSKLDYKVECLIGQHPVDSLLTGHHHQQNQQQQQQQQQQQNLLPSPYNWNDQHSNHQQQQQYPPYPVLPSQTYKPPSFFNDGPGRFWKLYLILLFSFGYYHRKRGWQFFVKYILPKWALIMKYYHQRVNKQQKNQPSDKKKSKNVKIKEFNNNDNKTTPSHPINNISTANKSSITNTTSNTSTPPADTDYKTIPSSSASSNNHPTENEKIPTSSQSITNSNQNEGSRDSLDTLSTSPYVVLKDRGFDLQDFRPLKSTVLDISDNVLGYGSHGTVVYKGTFDGRAVAVKRLLIDFYDIAVQEVKLLQESDDHPNVVRYFYKEETDRFLYIALELCIGSLHDCIERSLKQRSDMQLYDLMDPTQVLYQITSGIQHLHSLKIVHRDLKPQNILVAPSKNPIMSGSSSIHRDVSNNSKGKGHSPLRILISDFGLCKKLDGEQSSFHYTAASPAGTSGWRAPELLAGALAATSFSLITSTSSSSLSDQHSSLSNSQLTQDGRIKATRSIDIFSAGCIFYYVLSNGDHPFGNRFGRENNILDGKFDISALESMGEDGMEAYDLIESMIDMNPRARPSADKILSHPFFWSTSKRLTFLQDASDRFEIEQRDPPSPLLVALERNSKKIIGFDWHRRIDRVVLNDLGKFRKYDGRRIRDLLRVLRNKKHHWQDLPEKVKQTLGEPPDQFLYYFTARFPRLLLHTYHIIAEDKALINESTLKQYF